MEYRQYLTKEQALQKAKQYCAYQERCHSEVKEKLYGLGLKKVMVGELLSTLIEENYLNEERFAIQFAGGRFRVKHWGRLKIRFELKRKQVSDYCIKKAMAAIDDEEYNKELKKGFAQKLRSLRAEKNSLIKMKKVQAYLLQKGYEPNLVRELIDAI